MKAKTQIEQVVKAAYDAYAEYARRIDHIPVKPVFPHVSWVRGSLKSPKSGWRIDGRLYPGSAEQVITYWLRQERKWTERTRKKLESLPETPEPGQDEE